MAPDELGSLHVGTSGWIYKHWKFLFYPDKLPQSRWFEFYSQRFDTVEINFTFYRLPPRSVFEAWHDKAPANFIFAVKGSRYVTHMRRLLDPEPHLELFFQRASALQAHCGPILWQLPPSFTRDDQRLRIFVRALPTAYQHVIEFRNESWFVPQTYELLKSRDIALCIADSVKRPATIALTADWTYIRFHEGLNGGDYTDAQLDQWTHRIREFRKQGIQTWAYFNNDPHGYAIKNAMALRERLTGTP